MIQAKMINRGVVLINRLKFGALIFTSTTGNTALPNATIGVLTSPTGIGSCKRNRSPSEIGRIDCGMAYIVSRRGWSFEFLISRLLGRFFRATSVSKTRPSLGATPFLFLNQGVHRP